MTTKTLAQMISADLLKLRKKRSVTGWALVLTAGVMLVFYVYSLALHATDPAHHDPAGGLHHFSNAFTSLGLDFGTIAAILIGVEAGVGESADGTLKELIVTGRSRLALFASRLPAALSLTLTVVACAMAVSIIMTFAFSGETATPNIWLVVRSVAWVALCNGVVCCVAVGLGAITGSRPAALIGLIAWQTVASRLLIDTTALGSARRAVLDAALSKLMPGPHSDRSVAMPSAIAALITVTWMAVAIALGAWRTAVRDV